MRLSRTDRSRVADWWFTVDHVLVGAILALIVAGLVLSLAASPAVALRKGLPTYYFVERHLLFSLLGIVIITSLGSGFTLLALDSSTRLLITGAVLLAAVIVDSLARARRR